VSTRARDEHECDCVPSRRGEMGHRRHGRGSERAHTRVACTQSSRGERTSMLLRARERRRGGRGESADAERNCEPKDLAAGARAATSTRALGATRWRRRTAAARRERTQEEGHGSERAHARVACERTAGPLSAREAGPGGRLRARGLEAGHGRPRRRTFVARGAGVTGADATARGRTQGLRTGRGSGTAEQQESAEARGGHEHESPGARRDGAPS
jgi:hypothetical protein